MTWGFDLTNYNEVKSNASMIYLQISTQQMPPPPYLTLTKEQIAAFKTWMDSGFPAKRYLASTRY